MIFRSCESFVDPLAKEKLTALADASGLLTSLCSALAPFILSLLTLCHPGAGVNTCTPSQIWGQFGLKSNQAKVCLLVCVLRLFERLHFPMWFIGRLYQGLCWQEGRQEQGENGASPGAGEENISDWYCCKYCIFWSHCLGPEQLHWYL